MRGWLAPIRTAAAAVAAAVVASAAWTPAADAGTYTFHSCKTPSGAPAGVGDWSYHGNHSTSGKVTNGCPDGPLIVDMTPNRSHPADDSARITFRAPADTTIRAYQLYRTVYVANRYNYWRKEIVGTSWNPVERCHSTAQPPCLRIGWVTDPFHWANDVSSSDRTDLLGIDFQLTCGEADGGGTACPAVAHTASVALHRSDITLHDGYAPRFDAAPSGTLVDSAVQLTGSHGVFVQASDRGAGIKTVTAEIDGRPVASTVLDANGGRCAEPYTTAQPCKTKASGWLWLDTAQLPDGQHTLRLLLTDATDTNVTEWGPVRIATANDACTPSPRIDSLTLRAGLVPRVAKGAKRRGKAKRPQARRKLRLSRSRGSRVRGRLIGATGEPLGGATVCVVGRQDRANAGLVKYGTVVTDPEGRFSFDIPGGPSRRVTAVHRVPGGAVVADMRLMVPARIALRPSRRVLRNGQAVVLRGRLRDGPHPRRPLLVELQSRRSSGWQTFGTTTARGGRFKFRYRFTRTSGVQRYQLRARVARQAVYPYATGASKPVTLEVRG